MNEEIVKFCPKCGRNFATEAEWCEHCSVKLVSEETLDATKQLFEQNTVVVHVAETALEAELLREILEDNGIICALVGDVPATVLPFTINGLAKVRILVLEDAAAAARAIIQEALEQADKYEPEAEVDNEEEAENEDSNSQ